MDDGGEAREEFILHLTSKLFVGGLKLIVKRGIYLVAFTFFSHDTFGYFLSLFG